ncbi:alpha-mannosidase [Parasphaerochaeta coccoides]|uniref:Alpha-mannosidase n=1 Tax=Parasphaerochaeta coccoides (strain ATCC BAA-1237 / DSM 17374 / SPN1) TaxID=760011 RepID=F4GM15_PARC1|nr:glycoside hydrolase family 38 C-terminal domain-containing protein [Parasphaerochaeta coccoides]AEC02490.1 Alpha-mannosidase [Parasphaerochaeta coccoides DSM 17374]
MNKTYFTDSMAPLLDMLKRRALSDRTPVTGVSRAACGYHGWQQDHAGLPWEEAPSSLSSSLPFGGSESHCLFKAHLSVPPGMKGRHPVCLVETGATDIWNYDNPQFIVFLDGRMTCGLDVNHTEFDIPDSDNPLELILYAYCSSKYPDAHLNLAMASRDDDITGLYYDLLVLYETAIELPDENPAYSLLVRTCMEAARLLDTRNLTSAAFHQSILQARAFILNQKALGTPEGSRPVLVAAVGHSHIDVAWLWTLDQTREKTLRSFSTVDYLMDRYPSYVFSGSQPQLYDFVREESPELYSRIKRRVDEGRWEIEGGMWVESDCNLPSGESLVRQFLYGKRFISEEFGRQSRVLWLPDTFGFNANLPQIMKQCGTDYFMTTKLGWNESDTMPHDTFIWTGIDGSTVLVHMVTTKNHASPVSLLKNLGPTTYNGLLNASQVMGTWQRYQDKTVSSSVLHCYGYGDGGGGPTAAMLEQGARFADGVPGCLRVHPSTVREFFENLERTTAGEQLPSWYGELYLQYHQGTFTTMAGSKKYNRVSEQQTMDTEFFRTVLWQLQVGGTYPHEKLEDIWKAILLNQFHDILPGSSIRQVYEDSWKQYEKIGRENSVLTKDSLMLLSAQTKARKGDIVVFNTTGFTRNALVSVSCDMPEGIRAADGEALPSTVSGGTLTFLARGIPAKGWKVFSPVPRRKEDELPPAFSFSENHVETPFHTIDFDDDGYIRSLLDKTEDRQLVPYGGRINVMRLHEDLPREYDAWNIGKQGDAIWWDVTGSHELSCTEISPLCMKLTLRRSFGKSALVQDILFYSHTARIDFRTEVDWQEDHKMLRVLFPLDIHAYRATCDIAFGTWERDTHANTSWDEARFEVPAHKWTDVSEAGYGAALLNTCKYGYSVHDGVIALSLLRSPAHPNPDADRGRHIFTYALLPHAGTYREGNVVQEGYDLQFPLLSLRMEADGSGFLPSCFSFVSVNAPNIVIETVKKCEERESMALRLYEAHGKAVRCSLASVFPIGEAWECNALEERKSRLPSDEKDGTLLSFRPFELKTVELVPFDSVSGHNKISHQEQA